MFLELLRRRNPHFLDAISHLHASGDLPPNCFAIDLDAVSSNAAAYVQAAEPLGLKVFAMTKQLGRNPDVSAALVSAGITHAVGVDLQCAIAAHAGGLDIGHLGHLVQIPRHEAATAAALKPLYWTVYNETKAREAGSAAVAAGRVQDVLVRVFAPEDTFYPGHEGGFPADRIVQVARMIDAIPGLRFAGVTSFPATLFDQAKGNVVATPNRATLTRVAEMLKADRGRVEVNAPGTTSVSVLESLAEAGATQVEPGHGLTGTTPLHAVRDLVEQPAIAYVSEVSHLHSGRAFVFGGGLYVDPVLGEATTKALIVEPGSVDVASVSPLGVEMPSPAAIDYYATVPVDSPDQARVGDTVIFGFRAQAFVTRALTAAISGISIGKPHVEAVWSADGSPRQSLTLPTDQSKE